MTRYASAIGLLVSASLLVGCSGGEAGGPAVTTAPPAAAAKPASAAAESPHPQDPIAAKAYEFLDAVFAGDTQRADSQLTPAAAKQLAASGQRFAPPGSGPMRFRLGDKRVFSGGRAAVECTIVGQIEGQTVEEQMVCLLKQSGSAWGVSGIAYEVSPGEPPTVFNFEQPTAQPAVEYVASPPAQQTTPEGRVAAPPATTLYR